MNRSLKDKLKVSVLLNETVAATGNSLGVDTSAGEALLIAVQAGDFAFSETNSLNVQIQHADVDTDGSYAAVTDADVFETVGSSGSVIVLDGTDNAETINLYSYKGDKKFVRVRLVEAGTVSAPMAITAIQGMLKAAPDA